MKIHIRMFLFAVLLCEGSAACARELSKSEKFEFVEFYRSWSGLLKEFPNHPEVWVIFIDIDDDGRTEAMATSHGARYETGSDWIPFEQSAGKWKPIQGYDEKNKENTPATAVYARAGEFLQVVKSDASVEFIVLRRNFDNRAPEGLGPLDKTKIRLDKDGERGVVMRQEGIPNLEHYLAYGGPNRLGMIASMEVVSPEYFRGTETSDK